MLTKQHPYSWEDNLNFEDKKKIAKGALIAMVIFSCIAAITNYSIATYVAASLSSVVNPRWSWGIFVILENLIFATLCIVIGEKVILARKKVKNNERRN